MSVSSVFKFKHFQVRQDHVPMKINTDGVLLGAWVNCENTQTALDVGTGTGVIALMLCQRNQDVNTVGIDLSEVATVCATANFLHSPWANRLQAVHSAIQNYQPQESFDLIVSNPPYFINSLKSPLALKNTARHTDLLPHNDLIQFYLKYATANGRLALILPTVEAELFLTLCTKQGLFCHRLCRVCSHEDKSPIRYLMEFGKQEQDLCIESPLIMHENGERGYSQAYKTLTKDFFLAH